MKSRFEANLYIQRIFHHQDTVVVRNLQRVTDRFIRLQIKLKFMIDLIMNYN